MGDNYSINDAIEIRKNIYTLINILINFTVPKLLKLYM